jgi:hypothetical protein
MARPADARKRDVKSPDRAEALMLCFGRIRPGILDFAKREAERERQLDNDARSGRYRPPPTAEQPQGNRLLEIYNRGMKAIQDRQREQDDAPGPTTDTFTARNVCAHCGGDLRLDGIEYHCVVEPVFTWKIGEQQTIELPLVNDRLDAAAAKLPAGVALEALPP